MCFVLCMGLCYWSGCSTRQEQDESADPMFRMNLGTEPPTLDPAEVNDLVAMTVVSNIMRGLTQYGDNHTIEPALASHWHVTPDGKIYTFFLRPTARWSDGKPVTARDFVYAWQRVLDPAVGSTYAYLLFDIKNAKALYEGKLHNPNLLGVHALDTYTLQIQLNRPLAYFLGLTSFATFLPQRKDIIARYKATWTEAGHMVTTGPYQLATWDHENDVVLKPNPYYWAGIPKNAGIHMLMIPEPNTSLIMYENNELDFVETSSSLPRKEVRRLQNRPDYRHQTLHAITYIGLNTKKPPFNNPMVRQALASAVDRSYFPKLFQGGETPIRSWISPGLLGYNAHVGLAFDIKKAQALLAEAGYPNGKGFPSVEFLFANTTPENRQMAEILQYQWKKHLNIPIRIANVEWKVYLKQLQNEPPPLYLLQWYVDYPDADSFMSMNSAGSGNNHTGWTSPQYDHWVSQAASALNPTQRQHFYDNAQHLLLEEGAAMIPLYVIPKSYLIKSRVSGFSLDELNVVRLDNVRINRGLKSH